jgi:sec-independent protein translocase protein TatC
MSRDLFDDTTMSFGEHLEILRSHLIKALLGLVIAVIISLYFSNHVIRVMEIPLRDALREYYTNSPEVQEQLKAMDERTKDTFDIWGYVYGWFGYQSEKPKVGETKSEDNTQVVAHVDAIAIWKALHALSPQFPEPPQDSKPEPIEIRVPRSQVTPKIITTQGIITTGPEEAFMIYMKVALITGLVLSSPWVFYQLWLFVAAGLYPHERKYVYIYLPMSLFLFLGGALFCFFAVLPFVLKFLIGFNAWLDLSPQIRIGEWISFAVMLPLMFGLSFQLPLVMLFLERISIFQVKDYREKRRISILVISILSMVLTPSDPVSMMLMMIPLVLLYEFGIFLCTLHTPHTPFEEAAS